MFTPVLVSSPNHANVSKVHLQRATLCFFVPLANKVHDVPTPKQICFPLADSILLYEQRQDRQHFMRNRLVCVHGVYSCFRWAIFATK
jgi:hypothetical protein